MGAAVFGVVLQAGGRGGGKVAATEFPLTEDTMLDPQTSTRSQRIQLTEDHDVRGWCDSLGVTEEQLRIAVAAVGDELDEVRGHLGCPNG